MLMLIEHDSILSTPEARQSLAAFVAHRPNINVAVFHSAKLSAAEVCEAYPPALRERARLLELGAGSTVCGAVVGCSTSVVSAWAGRAGRAAGAGGGSAADDARSSGHGARSLGNDEVRRRLRCAWL